MNIKINQPNELATLKTKMCTCGVINESPEEREAYERLMSNYNEPKTYNPNRETLE